MKFVEIKDFDRYDTNHSCGSCVFINVDQISSIGIDYENNYIVNMNNGSFFRTDKECFETIMEEIKNDET